MSVKVEFHKSDIMRNVIRLLENLTVGDITVPAGFESDGASVPRIFWRLVFPPTDNKAIRGAIVHDYIYRHGAVRGEYTDSGVGFDYRLTKEDADKLFYKLLIEDGVPKWRAWLAYSGVRMFGGSSWKGGEK